MEDLCSRWETYVREKPDQGADYVGYYAGHDACAFQLRGLLLLQASAQTEWRCEKCGAACDERWDCCEVHALTTRPVGSLPNLAPATPKPDLPSEARADGVKGVVYVNIYRDEFGISSHAVHSFTRDKESIMRQIEARSGPKRY